jgi:molybdopterin converting factor small subunit
MVNGIDISLSRGLDTPVKDHDVVAIFPPIAGGKK